METALHNSLMVLRAAGEETRIRILAALDEGELAVTELTQILGQSQPRISRHLKLLQEAGLIYRRREGAWAFYALARTGFAGDLNALILRNAVDGRGEIALDKARRGEVYQRRQAIAEVYFAENAAAWDQLRAMHAPEEAVKDAALALLAPKGTQPFSYFLDLGAGTGQMLSLFAPHFEKAIGYDLNQQMLSVARARVETESLQGVQLVQADILRLPEKNDVADAVICHQVLHFLNDPALALKEIARVLRPEGTFLLVDFAPHHLEFLRKEHAHRRLGFSTEEIRDLALKNGLYLTESRHIPPPEGAEDEKLTVSLWLIHKPALSVGM